MALLLRYLLCASLALASHSASSHAAEADCCVRGGSAEAGCVYIRLVDATGAPIPAAEVLIRPCRSGRHYSETSDEVGCVAVPDISPGEYSIDIVCTGFHFKRLHGIDVVAGQVTFVSTQLDVLGWSSLQRFFGRRHRMVRFRAPSRAPGDAAQLAHAAERAQRDRSVCP